uniref:Uncharacterized protein n=1 Tax=Oryza brachyantha TaxID=4533 RepID=J3M9G6_ORYBR
MISSSGIIREAHLSAEAEDLRHTTMRVRRRRRRADVGRMEVGGMPQRQRREARGNGEGGPTWATCSDVRRRDRCVDNDARFSSPFYFKYLLRRNTIVHPF